MLFEIKASGIDLETDNAKYPKQQTDIETNKSINQISLFLSTKKYATSRTNEIKQTIP